jgi:uncharacterized protein DUF6801
MSRRASRGRSGTALASGLILAAGALAGTAAVTADAASITGPQQVHQQLAYTCRFPSGAAPTAVTVDATFPAAVTAGQAIQPSGVTVTVALPAAVTAGLRRGGAATAAGAAGLATQATPAGGAGKPVTLHWRTQTAHPARIPATGGLALATGGSVPAVTVTAPGRVIFAAAGLALTLIPRTSSGAATSPPTLAAACTPSPGAATRLVTVPVVGGVAAPASPSPSPSPATRPGHRRPAPKGCGHIKVVGSGSPSCAYVTGFSDVRKLKEAAFLQPKPPAKPGLLNVDFGEKTKVVKTHKGVQIIARSSARLYFHGRAQLPPLQATFLAFGFMPVTASLQLTELTPIKILSVSDDFTPFGIKVTSKTTISLRLYGVTVNGTPLDVGPHCQVASPIELTLIGVGHLLPRPSGYTVPGGGPLTGTLTVGRFSGCGVGEDVNPIFDGSVSGPHNFTILTQGKLCFPTQPPSTSICPPRPPKPIK